MSIRTIEKALETVSYIIANIDNGESKRKKKNKDKGKEAVREHDFNKDIEKFYGLTFKSFCKKNDFDRDNKKSMRKYCEYLCEFLPSISYQVRYILNKNTQDAKDKKQHAIEQFTSDQFMDWIDNRIDKDEYPDELEYYPLLIGAVVADVLEYDEEVPDWLKRAVKVCGKLEADELEKLSKKADIPRELGLKLLMCVPTRDAYEYAPTEYIRRMMVTTIIDTLCTSEPWSKMLKEKDNIALDKYFSRYGIGIRDVVIQILLQSADENYTEYTYDGLGDWALERLNELDQDSIVSVIICYCEIAQKRQNYIPRYVLTELPSEYINIRSNATRVCNKYEKKGYDKILK